jgi:hypothetical protein
LSWRGWRPILKPKRAKVATTSGSRERRASVGVPEGKTATT